jgi:predicted peptidase
MRSFLFLVTVLFVTSIVSAQQIDTTRPPLDIAHPGVLLTVEEDFPRSPIDGYNLYVPKSCEESSKKYPIIVFLHGGRLVGGDVANILNFDLPNAILESPSMESELETLLKDTFIVIMPHIKHGEFYEGEAAMRSIIDRVIQNYNGDPERIYLTGLSRGGYGAWGLASRMSDVFAAVAPICGGSAGITDYNNLEGLPIWVTHNTDDNVVPYRASDGIVKRLEKILEIPFHQSSSIKSANYEKHTLIFTSRTTRSHDAWTEMHSSIHFYKWLLRFSK